MAIVIAALLPVFLLIVLGFGLKRSLMRLETQWHGLERLTYYVLFPALLIQTLVKADLSSVPVAGVGERLCAGPADGRRRAPAGANHHAADHSRGHHHADRDCTGGVDRHCERSEAIQEQQSKVWIASSRSLSS